MAERPDCFRGVARLVDKRREMRERWLAARAEVAALKAERRVPRPPKTLGRRLRGVFRRLVDDSALALPLPGSDRTVR